MIATRYAGPVKRLRPLLGLFSSSLLLLLVGGCAATGRGYEAALLLGDVAAGGEESWLTARTEEPRREEIRYRVNEYEYVADIYHSGEEPRAALVLLHGFSEYGKDDPRLREFAESLARTGFNVFVPDIPGLREFRVSPEDSRYVSDAVGFLSQQPQLAPEQRIGAGGFSYAVGPLMLAALDPDTAPRIDFIVAIGGYYDIVDAITFITTGYHHLSGEREYREPDEVARWQFLTSYLYRLEDPRDRTYLEYIAQLRTQDPHADVEHLVAGLGPDGLTVFELLTNEDPDRVQPLLDQLPSAIQDDIRALDLANRDFSQLEAHLLLIHGIDDAIIPPTHSEALAAQVPEDQSDLHLVGGLFHVDVSPGLGDSWRLWRVAQNLLWLRDEG